ncbi:MAG: OmpA family protein [Sulfurimonas sp.]|jgi:peptidoglycan-associated lipoprotein
MKKVAYMSAVLALLVFTGCSTKEPTIDASAANGSAAGSKTGNSTASTESASSVQPAGMQSSSTAGSSVISPVSNVNGTDSSSSTANASNSNNAAGVNSVLFDFDKFDIREDMQGTLKADAGLLKSKTFKLEGNCDEFGSDEYNFALGLKRANAVKTELVNEGVNADSIAMTSLGEGNPVCTDKTQECWSKNRRVDFKLP